MGVFPLIIVTATLVYCCRLAGLTLDLSDTSSRREQFLRFVPLSVFSALITLAILREPELIGIKSAVLMIAGVVILETRKLKRLSPVGDRADETRVHLDRGEVRRLAEESQEKSADDSLT